METSAADMIALFRRKAAKYQEMADTMEKELKEAASSNGSGLGHVPKPASEPHEELTVENVKRYLKRKKGRVYDLGRHFKVKESLISKIVQDPTNGIISGDRGWLTLASQQPLPFEHKEPETRP
jgi:hypothetical protein